MVDFNIYLITDRHQVPAGQPLLSVIEEALKGGVRAIQLREKDLALAELRPLAKELRKLTREYGAKLLINRDIKLVQDIDADGIHLGGDSIPTSEAREILGADKLIGVSTHSKAEIHTAAGQGADFVTFGPVYATPSKAIYGPPQGLEVLKDACLDSPVPVFALGGITPERAIECRQSGANGIALISAIIAASDPKEASRRLLA